MRQIKFRGKDKYTNKWVFGDLAHSKGISGDGLYDRVMVGGYHVIEESVDQFTGLLDKSGRDIYEGDIVECCADVCKVVYSNHYSGFALDKQGWAFLHFFGEAFSPKDCIVIGNVVDNPELMKGGEE